MDYQKHNFAVNGTLAEFHIFASKYTDLKVGWSWGNNTPPSADDPDWHHQVVIYPNPHYEVGPDGEIIATAAPIGRKVIVVVETTSLVWLNRARKLECDSRVGMQQSRSKDTRILKFLYDYPQSSQTNIAAETGINPGGSNGLSRCLTRLIEWGFVQESNKKYSLTESGEKQVSDNFLWW